MKYKLSEIVEIISGGTPKKTIKDYWNGEIPWITIKDFRGKYPETVTANISKKGLEQSPVKLTDENDVLISARGTVGEVMMVHKGYTFNQSIYGLRANKDKVIAEYIYYWLLANKQIFTKNVHGSVFDTITKKTFDYIQVDVPNIRNQKEIITKLNIIDAKINTNNQINDNLATLKTSIFDKLFKNKMSSHLNGNLSNITIITSGKRPKKKFDNKSSVAKYPIVGASKIMGYTDRYLYNESILTTGRVGTHGVIQRFRKPVWVSDNSFVFKTEHEDYLFEILNNWIKYSALNRGSTQPLITQTDLKNIDIYVPTKEEFYHFESVVTPLTDQQFSLISENDNLKKAKAALLSKLF